MTKLELIEPAAERPFLERIKPYQSTYADPRKCQVVIQYGLFFDGTDNNRDRDSPQLADTNIARLCETYPKTPEVGVDSLYVPGVGTAFDEIGSPPEGWKGTAFGVGCEARVLFALLKTLDFLRKFVTGRERYSKDQLKVLCKQDSPSSRKDLNLIISLGTIMGLRERGDRGKCRESFLRNEAQFLHAELVQSNVRVTEYVVDIFGFSRGAAEARAYATWLTEILESGRLAGVPLTIRFMGIIDTVASAGVSEMLLDGVMNKTGGHDGWARSESLRIPKQVANCVHLVAMHELRKNFPVDELSMDGERPSQFLEVAYPGSHSDVGGGYAPGALGVSADESASDGDSRKLSQIPLNHLFQYARSGFVPLNKKSIRGLAGSRDPFALSPQLMRDFSVFVQASGRERRPLRDWMAVYLAWRWNIRERFASSGQVRNAKNDRNLLLAGHRKMMSDAEILQMKGPKHEALKVIKDLVLNRQNQQFENPTPPLVASFFEPEARDVLRRAMSTGMPPDSLTSFFEKYVHDSYAGFTENFTEPSGYWRYRKGFNGSDTVMNAEIGEDGSEVGNLS